MDNGNIMTINRTLFPLIISKIKGEIPLLIINY